MSKKSKKAAATKGLQNVSLRVYKGHAVIEGAYPITLTEGANTFQIEGLPTAYQPRSLRFEPFVGPGEVTLGPRRYRAANLDRETLRSLFLNKKVCVRYLSGKSEKHADGKFLGLDGSTVLLKTKDGIREIPNFLGFDYDQLPDGVSNTPALQVTVTASKKGEYQANIAFKADGFDWDADYTLVYDEMKNLVDWEAQVHITNSSGASFENAEISVVAGDTNEQPVARAAAMPMGGARLAAASFDAESAGLEAVQSKSMRSVSAESLGQVKEYKVPDRGDVAQGDDQTLDFFAANGVSVKRELRVRTHSRWHHSPRVEAQVRTILQFVSGKETPLNIALPAGTVKVLQSNKAGKKVQTGGAWLKDSALGEEIKLETGTDFDVKAVRLVKKEDRQDSYKALPVPEAEEAPAMHEGPTFGTAEMHRVSKPAKKQAKPYERTTVITKQCVFEVFNGKEFDVDVVFEEYTDAQLKFKDGHGFTETTNGRHEQTVKVCAGKKVQVPYTVVYTNVEQVNLTDEQARAFKAL